MTRDESREHGRRLFTNQLCVVVLIELIELDQGPRQPGLAANLSRSQGAKQMDDLLSWDRHQIVAIDRQARVTRMLAVQVVGNPTPKGIKLDAATDRVTRCTDRVQAQRQVLGLQNLQLDRHTQAIFLPSIADADQAFATLNHRPTCK